LITLLKRYVLAAMTLRRKWERGLGS